MTAPAPPADRLATAWRYLALGFTHIVPEGLDHMLFVLGIYLLSGRARSVLWQVSAFTVAHSITLGLSMYGIVAVSPTDRRAADRAVDRVRRHREHLPVGARVVAGGAGLRVRAAARDGFRRRAQGARAAALGVRDRAADVQCRRRGRAAGGDRRGVPARSAGTAPIGPGTAAASSFPRRWRSRARRCTGRSSVCHSDRLNRPGPIDLDRRPVGDLRPRSRTIVRDFGGRCSPTDPRRRLPPACARARTPPPA